MLTLLLLHCGRLAKLRGFGLKLRTHETLLMAIVSSLPWMREPPSPRPALGVWPSITTELGKADSAKARIVVGRRTPFTPYVLPSKLVSAVNEERFDANSRRFGDSTHHKGLPQHRRTPCDNPSLKGEDALFVGMPTLVDLSSL